MAWHQARLRLSPCLGPSSYARRSPSIQLSCTSLRELKCILWYFPDTEKQFEALIWGMDHPVSLHLSFSLPFVTNQHTVGICMGRVSPVTETKKRVGH